jgi:hypothetical protein
VYQNNMAALQNASSSLDGIATDQADRVIDVLAGIALEPEGTIAAAGTALVTAAVSDLVEKAVNAVIGAATAPATTLEAPSVATWESDWVIAASDAYLYASQYKNPVLADTAAQYAKQYHCAPFLTSTGTLVANASLPQQQAFNAWLMDPAVANGGSWRRLVFSERR